ncbi:polysaccharide deacetylase family protein [Pseudalkalibacillus caeni]|uniref:Polysaccharide deacetylase family protein n=1 Tax=Exobacillus caeni TaxID=2574798 RepID=A0A5R9F1X1_9BACL|nr:polysaccharide deacetylase family protein [Pseudalkalibacillus caeni]TLS37632.1 polysaccharide deacetylase family protein [Pseudalkalibacillus caeni]
MMLFISETNANPVKEDRYFFEKQGRAIWEVPTEKKVVAITFDDGPSEKYTPQILDVLKKYDAKATFFVVGSRLIDQPDIVKRQVKAGHELANHTYDHPNFRGLTEVEIRDEIRKTKKAIFDLTGYYPVLFRPPGGFYNNTIISTANNEGYTVVMWSWHQDTYDWKQPGVNKIVRKVVKNVKNGDIILMHDYGGNRRQTVEALKQIIPALEKKGYRFITVSELIKMHPNYRYLERIGKINS